MSTIDDKNIRTADAFLQDTLLVRKGEELFQAARANFTALVVQLVETQSAVTVDFVEQHYTQLFDAILSGWGGWVREVFAEARSSVSSRETS